MVMRLAAGQGEYSAKGIRGRVGRRVPALRINGKKELERVGGIEDEVCCTRRKRESCV